MAKHFPILGAHMSISGGYYRAIELARAAACDCVQLFTKNNNQWRAKDISQIEANQFRDKLKELNIVHPLSHSCYLLNLGSSDKALWQKSIDTYVVEMRRAEQLGIPFVVLHPGAHMGMGEEAGIANVVTALNEVLQKTSDLHCQVLLETTAGQGSGLGHRFEHLGAMIERVSDSARVGVCFDTCHVFAAGYPLASKREYAATMNEFDRRIGLPRIKAFHLNDSKRQLGSRVDRHEHIGRGQLGHAPFQNLLNDRRFRDIPMYLETPKEQENGEDMDVINLRTLRELVRRTSRRL